MLINWSNSASTISNKWAEDTQESRWVNRSGNQENLTQGGRPAEPQCRPDPAMGRAAKRKQRIVQERLKPVAA